MTRWLATLAILTASGAAHADVSLVDKENGTLTLGGYARSVLMVQDTHRLDLPELIDPDQTSGLAAGILRMEWTSRIGDRLTLDAHHRLAWRAPQTGGIAAQTGLGVTAEPVRTVDLSTNLVSNETMLLSHDIDRLAARIYLNNADLYLGRQAISWGNALLLPSTDLWSRFGQFELDTTEKPGVDAARVLVGVSNSTELEFVLVDRGSVEDLSMGVRGTLYLDRSDVYALAAKNWHALNFGGGFARDFDTVSLRGDALLPFAITGLSNEEGFGGPRMTLGIDHFRTKWNVSGELHYNGAGAMDPDDYVENAVDNRVYNNSEVQLLGRVYAGLLFGVKPVEPFSFTLMTLTNVLDPSAVFAPAATWTPMQDVELSVGGYVPVGRPPVTEAILPNARSEFGSLPVSGYFQMAAYY